MMVMDVLAVLAVLGLIALGIDKLVRWRREVVSKREVYNGPGE